MREILNEYIQFNARVVLDIHRDFSLRQAHSRNW